MAERNARLFWISGDRALLEADCSISAPWLTLAYCYVPGWEGPQYLQGTDSSS